MEYECGPLLLYSQDKLRMMDLLSDVFEFEVDSVTDSIHRGPLFLRLCERDENTRTDSSGIVFSFRVKNEEELSEIVSKYNFFLYRKSISPMSEEKIELMDEGHAKTLIISDVDKRHWRFEFRTREF